MPYICLDTETTGLPVQTIPYTFSDPQAHPQDYDAARLTEIGYIIYSDDDIEIKNVDYQVEDAYTLRHLTRRPEVTRKLKDILDIMCNDFKTADTLICHNINFDYNILLNEAIRANHFELIETLEKFKRVCTMKLALRLKIFPYRAKLTNLYKHLLHKTFDQTHEALSDAYACALCYQKMKASKRYNDLSLKAISIE